MIAITDPQPILGPDGRPVASTQIGTTERDALATLAYGQGPSGPVALAANAEGRLRADVVVQSRPVRLVTLTDTQRTNPDVAYWDNFGNVRTPGSDDYVRRTTNQHLYGVIRHAVDGWRDMMLQIRNGTDQAAVVTVFGFGGDPAGLPNAAGVLARIDWDASAVNSVTVNSMQPIRIVTDSLEAPAAPLRHASAPGLRLAPFVGWRVIYSTAPTTGEIAIVVTQG